MALGNPSCAICFAAASLIGKKRMPAFNAVGPQLFTPSSNTASALPDKIASRRSGPLGLGASMILPPQFLNVAVAHAVSLEHFFDGVDGGGQFAASAGRDAQGIFLLSYVFERLYADVSAHGENQSIPSGKDADGAQGNFLFIKAAAEIGHRRETDRIAETERVLLSAHENGRAGTAQFGIAPAHGDIELGLARQFRMIEKREADDVGDVDPLRCRCNGELDRLVHSRYFTVEFEFLLSLAPAAGTGEVEF